MRPSTMAGHSTQSPTEAEMELMEEIATKKEVFELFKKRHSVGNTRSRPGSLHRTTSGNAHGLEREAPDGEPIAKQRVPSSSNTASTVPESSFELPGGSAGKLKGTLNPKKSRNKPEHVQENLPSTSEVFHASTMSAVSL